MCWKKKLNNTRHCQRPPHLEQLESFFVHFLFSLHPHLTGLFTRNLAFHANSILYVFTLLPLVSSYLSDGLLELHIKPIMIPENFCNDQSSYLLSFLRKKLRHFCTRIRRLIWKRPRPKVIIKRLGKLNSKLQSKEQQGTNKSTIRINGQLGRSASERPIRAATFNVAMFSLAPAVPKAEKRATFNHEEEDYMNTRPKSILKQSPIRTTMSSPEHVSKHKTLTRLKLKVSINLPDNEISLANTKLLSSMEGDEKEESSNMTSRRVHRSGVPVRSPVCFPSSMIISQSTDDYLGSGRSILEVLKEVDADILALQDVKAEEGKGMGPLSDLAGALGMKYVFAESWAPEYGNAVLSKWPIKRWQVQKIANDDDFRYFSFCLAD